MRPSLYKFQIELVELSATIQDVIAITFQIEVPNLLAERLRKLHLKLLPGRSVCHVTSAGIYTFRPPEVTKPSMLLASPCIINGLHGSLGLLSQSMRGNGQFHRIFYFYIGHNLTL